MLFNEELPWWICLVQKVTHEFIRISWAFDSTFLHYMLWVEKQFTTASDWCLYVIKPKWFTAEFDRNFRITSHTTNWRRAFRRMWVNQCEWIIHLGYIIWGSSTINTSHINRAVIFPLRVTQKHIVISKSYGEFSQKSQGAL